MNIKEGIGDDALRPLTLSMVEQGRWEKMKKGSDTGGMSICGTSGIEGRDNISESNEY